MIRPVQIRAARGLVGLSQTELARRAKIGLATLQRIEAAHDELRGNIQTIEKLQKALEAAGIVFIEQDDKHGPGVRLKDLLR